MKKTSAILFCLLFPFMIFSQESSDFEQSEQQNIVSKQDFKVAEITSLKIDCNGEDIKFYIFYGDEITVEVSSNNLKFQPAVEIQNTILTITDKYTPRKGDSGSVSIFLPYDFVASDYYISTKSGKISVQGLNATQSIVLRSVDGKIQGRDISSDYLEVSSKNGQVKFVNTKCSYFDVRTVSAPITLSLLFAPLAKSVCDSKNGKIEFELPQSEPFTVQAFSANGSFLNQQNDTISNPNPAIVYTNSTNDENDTAIIELSTLNGNIVLK